MKRYTSASTMTPGPEVLKVLLVAETDPPNDPDVEVLEAVYVRFSPEVVTPPEFEIAALRGTRLNCTGARAKRTDARLDEIFIVNGGGIRVRQKKTRDT